MVQKAKNWKPIINVTIHLIGIYSAYPYLQSLLAEQFNIKLPITSFQYQSVFSSIMGGPGLLAIGILAVKLGGKINRILGAIYILLGCFWLYRLIFVLFTK
jgi:hypothetical protein